MSFYLTDLYKKWKLKMRKNIQACLFLALLMGGIHFEGQAVSEKPELAGESNKSVQQKGFFGCIAHFCNKLIAGEPFKFRELEGEDKDEFLRRYEDLDTNAVPIKKDNIRVRQLCFLKAKDSEEREYLIAVERDAERATLVFKDENSNLIALDDAIIEKTALDDDQKMIIEALRRASPYCRNNTFYKTYLMPYSPTLKKGRWLLGDKVFAFQQLESVKSKEPEKGEILVRVGKDSKTNYFVGKRLSQKELTEKEKV